jgi:hypothetical protein
VYSSSDFDTTSLHYYLNNASSTIGAYTGIQFGVGSNGDAAISAIRTGDGESALAFGTRGGGVRGERVRIDSSGNFGLGGTTNSYGSQTTFTLSGTNVSRIDFRSNSVFTGTILSYQSITEGLRLQTEAGYPITFYPAGTERMRIDTSGSLLLGTTTNPTSGAFPRPTLSIKQLNDSSTGYNAIHIEAAGDQSVLGIGYNGDVFAFNTSYRSTGAYRGISFGTTNTERMRIDTSGNLLVGTTTNSANARIVAVNATGTGIAVREGPVRGNYESSDGGRLNYWSFGRDNISTGSFVFYLNGVSKSYIESSTGNYVVVSDSRAKKNIETLKYGLSEILALNPVMYHMVAELDTDKKHIGLIAQETKAVMDESVGDLKDEVNGLYGLDKSGLVPVLIKAIQEQQALITQLTARITALEGA